MESWDLQEVAIVIRPGADNVAVVTVDLLEKGTQLHHKGAAIYIDLVSRPI
jgi:hypothetical protein